MSADPLAFLTQSEDQSLGDVERTQGKDPLSFLNDPHIRTRYAPTLKEKVVRKASQVPIGVAEYATWPYNAAAMGANWYDKKIGKTIQSEAQRALGEIEEAIGQEGFEWTPEKKEMYDKIKKLSQDPGNLPKLDVGSFLEKGIEKTTGINVKPETGDEHLLRLGSAIRNPTKWGKSLAKLPKRFTKEGRQFLKAMKQEKKMTDFARTIKGNPEKEGWLGFAKEQGLSPEAATLLTQTEGKIDKLGKLAGRSKKYQTAVKEINEKIGYDSLIKMGHAGGPIRIPIRHKLEDSLQNISTELSGKLSVGEGGRAAIKEINDIRAKLDSKNWTIGDLIEARQAVGENINWNNMSKGDHYKNQIRMAFANAIGAGNPEIGKKLQQTDNAYKKFLHTLKHIPRTSPTVTVNGIPIPAELAVYGAAVSHTAGATTTLGVAKAGAKYIAQHMFTNFLVNPKYQGIHKKLMDATLRGDKEQIGRLMTIAYDKMKEDDPNFDQKTF